MSKYNYERMYKDLTNQIINLKGTDNLGQSVKITSVINLLNIVEDKENELAAVEAAKQPEPVSNDPTEQMNPAFSIRDFARENRKVKE